MALLMDIKNSISHLKTSDPKLYEAIISIIDQQDKNSVGLSNLIAGLKDPDALWGHSHRPRQARVFRAVDQNIATGVAGAAITFDTVIFDNDYMWDATNPTRITFRTPGKYLVGGCVFWDIGGGTRSIQVRRNGALSVVRSKFSIPAAEASNSANEAATYFEFAINDYIELIAAQTSGGVLPALGTADYGPIMWAVLIERGRNIGTGTENVVAGEV